MEPQIPTILTCRFCNAPISREDFFCPHCGKKLREKPVSTELAPLVWLFVLSALLPPFGFGLTLRYIRSDDDMAKKLGWISLFVTSFALLITLWLSKVIVDSIAQQLNQQMQGLYF